MASKQASKQDIKCICINFTIGTDGTYFFFVCMLVGMAQTYFVQLPINFVGGDVFFTGTPARH